MLVNDFIKWFRIKGNNNRDLCQVLQSAGSVDMSRYDSFIVLFDNSKPIRQQPNFRKPISIEHSAELFAGSK